MVEMDLTPSKIPRAPKIQELQGSNLDLIYSNLCPKQKTPIWTKISELNYFHHQKPNLIQTKIKLE